MAVDQNLSRTLLTDAAARYEGACRWSLIVCATVLVFHILTFSPFIRAQVERAAISGQSKLVAAAADDLRSALDAQEGAIKDVRADLDAMLQSKKADFQLLQRAVESIRDRPAAGGGPPDPAEPPPMAQMSLQAQRAGPRLQESARVGFFIEEIGRLGLTEQVRTTHSGRQLRDALQPIVETSVIEPQFEKVRARWAERLPGIVAKAETARDRLAEIARQFPEEPRWAALHGAIGAYIEALDKVTFGPPDDPEWWHSVVGKDDAVVEMKNVSADLIGSPSFREAAAALKNLLDDRAQLMEALGAQLKALEAQFEQQKERLGELIAPIKGVGLELSVVVANFPLVLALLLATVTVWPARRYGALLSASALAQRAGLIDAPAAATLWRPNGWTRSVALSFGQAALFIAWIAVAAWQLHPWADRDGLNLWLMTGAATLIVIGAALYKVYAMRAAAE